MADSAALTNDSAEIERQVDDAIRAQFDVLTKSEGALTVIGGLLAEACVTGVYPADGWAAAYRAYQLRGVSGKTDHVQISKLASFAYVALAWDRKGIKLVKALVERTEGLPKRYHIVQTVLVRLKKRRRGTIPPVSELAAILKDAQQPKEAKSRKTRKAAPEAEVVEAEAVEIEAVVVATSNSTAGSDFVCALDTLFNDFDTPPDIREACARIKNFVAGKNAADVTPGVTADG